jgi:hypothetical protein
MKLDFLPIGKSRAKASDILVLFASARPNQEVISFISKRSDVFMREAFTTRGVLQELRGVNLVVMDEVIELPDTSKEVMERSLELSRIPTTTSEAFLTQTEEWLGRARLNDTRQVTYLPARQINLINWSGGVGKTTLAMAICKRFVARTGLPAAMLELSMGGSALHARVSADLPEFFAIATKKGEPGLWHGVSLYPMDGRTIDVLWSEDPDGVRHVIDDIRKKHTLFVVDCFPGHPLFSELSLARPGTINLVVTSPRDDAVLQARRLMAEIPDTKHLVLNMAKSLADRTESGLSVTLPYNEGWAQSSDARLADPLLSLVYAGWSRRAK